MGIKRTRGRDPIALPMEFLSWVERHLQMIASPLTEKEKKRRGRSGSAEGLTAVAFMYGGVGL